MVSAVTRRLPKTILLIFRVSMQLSQLYKCSGSALTAAVPRNVNFSNNLVSKKLLVNDSLQLALAASAALR
jgi:hypothetical protein